MEEIKVEDYITSLISQISAASEATDTLIRGDIEIELLVTHKLTGEGKLSLLVPQIFMGAEAKGSKDKGQFTRVKFVVSPIKDSRIKKGPYNEKLKR